MVAVSGRSVLYCLSWTIKVQDVVVKLLQWCFLGGRQMVQEKFVVWDYLHVPLWGCWTLGHYSCRYQALLLILLSELC